MSDFYDISVTLADGTTTTMGGWAGHVLLIANPASTSAHADILAELFTDYAPRGFFALGTYDANDASDAAVEPDELEITDLIESNLPI